MAKLKFTYLDNEYNREAKVIEFEFADNINIKELKTIFIRMTHALGFQQKNITETFGEPEYDNIGSIDVSGELPDFKNITWSSDGIINFGPSVDGDIDHGNPEFDIESAYNYRFGEDFDFGLNDILTDLGIDKPEDDEE